MVVWNGWSKRFFDRAFAGVSAGGSGEVDGHVGDAAHGLAVAAAG